MVADVTLNDDSWRRTIPPHLLQGASVILRYTHPSTDLTMNDLRRM